MNPIKVLSVATIDELYDRLPFHHPHFLLFLAWDALQMPQENLIKLFRPLVDRGLVYFCAWGNNCEAVHDAIDACDYEERAETGRAESDDSVLMTTWHARDSLAQALWFFKVCAMPARSYDPAECARFAVAIGNPAWAAELERQVQSIPHDADDEVEPMPDDEDR
jgi:hypothetical protein